MRLPLLFSALIAAAAFCAPAVAQPRTETLTGEIKADSPKMAGPLRYACYEIDAQPGETISIHMETKDDRRAWAGFYVLGLETCDPTGLGGLRAPWPHSKMMQTVDFSLKAEGGRYWLMVFSSINSPHTLTIQHGATDPKAVALKASARAGAPAVPPPPPVPVSVETLSGEINAASPVLMAGRRYGCHDLEMTAGETVKVTLQSASPGGKIYVHGNGTCQDPETGGPWSYSGETTPSVTVKSPGGRYWILVTMAEMAGPYTVQVSRGGPALQATLLKAAAARPLPVPKGTASTFAATGTGKAGQIIQDCPTCPKMVVVPAGSFMMGSAGTEEGRSGDEGPRHAVTFARPLAIGAYEVTFDEWDACVADKQCEAITKDEGWGRGKRPVINVAKAQVDRYLAWLSDKTGHKYFLPSESEWEYAARAGTDTPWNTGDALITDDANILGVFKRTVPVGSFPPNAWGLYDVHGNVGEWVQDCGDVGYFGVPSDGGAATAPPATCPSVIRGGHFNSEPFKARSAYRVRVGPDPLAGGSATGFRVTRALD